MGNKCFTTSDYNKFTSTTLDAKIMQKQLVNESDLIEKIKKLSTKAKLKAEPDKIVKFKQMIKSFYWSMLFK